MAGSALRGCVGTDEAVRLLCVEPSRFRFLEMQCEDFLSTSRLEFPRGYSSGDLKILEAANNLHEEGLPPGAVKTRLAQMLAEPFAWSGGPNEVQSSSAVCGSRLVAIASGKGGVGKSNMALSLAVQLVSSGFRTAVLDADLGVANAHLLAGLKVGATLKDVVLGACAIEDIVARVPGGPDIVPGSSGIHELANLSPPKRTMLLAELRRLASGYDVVLVDTAAGVSGSVLDFVIASDFAVVVTTPEATAITDAYALIKLSFERNPHCQLGVVVNRARSAREGAAAVDRISKCVRRFLGRSIMDLGYMWEDSRVRRAVNERKPFVLAYPDSRASASIRRLSALLQRERLVLPRQQAERADS